MPINTEDSSTAENRPKRQKKIMSYYPLAVTEKDTPLSMLDNLQHVESAVKAIAEKFFSEVRQVHHRRG